MVVAHTVGSCPGDHRQRPAFEGEGERTRVHVAGSREHVVNQHRTPGEHGLDGPAGEPSDGVEVVGVHVFEDRPRRGQVLLGRRHPVVACGAHQVQVAQLAVGDHPAHLNKPGVEPPLEPHLQGHPNGVEMLEHANGGGHVQRDGLFRKQRAPGLRRPHEVLGVQRRWGGDHHSVHVVECLIDRRRDRPERCGPVVALGVGFTDHQVHPVDRRQVCGVDQADAAEAEQGDAHRANLAGATLRRTHRPALRGGHRAAHRDHGGCGTRHC